LVSWETEIIESKKSKVKNQNRDPISVIRDQISAIRDPKMRIKLQTGVRLPVKFYTVTDGNRQF
jgi:hypothetical protein